MTNTQKGHMLNLLSVLMVAIGPLFSKFGLLHISPLKAAVINAITILLASYAFGLLTKNTVTFYFEKEILMLAIFNTIGVVFLYISLDLLSPVLIGFLGRFYTVFAVLLSVFILGEKITKREVVFMVLAIIGVFMFADKGGDYDSNVIGTLCALIYTFFFALTNVFIKKTMSNEKNSNSILFTNNCISLVFVVFFAAISGDLLDGNYALDGILFMAVSSIAGGFVGTILLYEALRYLRFSIANVTRAFSPVLLAIISFPFFPVELTVQNIIGAVVLLGSILLLSMGDSNKPSVQKKSN